MRVNLFGIACLLLMEESNKFWGICVIDMKIKFEDYWVWEISCQQTFCWTWRKRNARTALCIFRYFYFLFFFNLL